MRSDIFQINTNLLIIQKNINIFTQETLYSSFIWKKVDTLHRKYFSKHPLFTFFSLVLKNREPYLISKTTLRSPSQNFLETFIFYRIFTSFHSRWIVVYFKQIPASELFSFYVDVFHSSEIVDFPIKLMVKNAVENECFVKKPSVMKTKILISVSSTL